jgi:hypothetical protein
MCVFIGYKYGGGGYRVWDPRAGEVVETRDVTFFEEGLPPPTIGEAVAPASESQDDLPQQRVDAPDEPLTVPVPVSDPSSTPPDGQQRLIVRLPGRNMPAAVSDDELAEHPAQDVARVPDFPARSLRSGRMRREPGGDINVAFSAGLPGAVLGSQLADPRTVREALAAPDADDWRTAMDREMDNLRAHDVFELVPREPGTRTIRLGWVLHRKFKNGTFDKHKARLVARGNHQRPGIDYGESFAPVMRLESLRTLLALAASHNLAIVQFDITSAYLHGTLKEKVFVDQPAGYVDPEKDGWVWRLKKGLYGLVQAGRTWNEELHAHMVGAGYTATPKDNAIYVKGSWGQGGFVAGGFWVDDFVGVGDGAELEKLAKGLDAKYGITGFGEARWVLGMSVERDRDAGVVCISQDAFIDGILNRFGLADAVPVSSPMVPGLRLSTSDCPTQQEDIDDMSTRPYRELVGCLSWLALVTRPDIAFVATTLARFSNNPGLPHWDAAKRVLRFLKGTRSWRLSLGGADPSFCAYTDADWGGDRDDRRSIGAYMVKIGCGTVSWKSKKQGCVALSSTEAEYMALCQVAKEAEWMVGFLGCLGYKVQGPVVLYVDNLGANALARNPVFHDRSKHIAIQYHYTRDLVKAGRVRLEYLHTKEMLADILTKPLPRSQHEYLARGIGLY